MARLRFARTSSTRSRSWVSSRTKRPGRFTPYSVSVQIRSDACGRVILGRTGLQADELPQTPSIVHYAPGTIDDDNMQECVGPPVKPKCAGTYWLRPLWHFRQEFWDTPLVSNGAYEVTVLARELAGSRGAGTVTVAVCN